MIIAISNFKMIGTPKGVKYVCHPFGILFRNLHIFYNHINPLDFNCVTHSLKNRLRFEYCQYNFPESWVLTEKKRTSRYERLSALKTIS